MHCELVVPALLSRWDEAQAAPATPALELLLARGRRARSEARSLERWLVDGFASAGQPLAAGALTLAGSGLPPGDAFWVRADPVHLHLGRDSLTLVPPDAMQIASDEAAALCAALSAHFEGKTQFVPASPARWCARLSAPETFTDASALARAGYDVDERLRSGEVPAAWHAFLNEAQMLLHAHPVNEAREARGERTINSVWLWGGGVTPRELHAPWHSVCAGEPIALGLARLAGKRALPLAANAVEWIRLLHGEGRQLAVLEAMRAPTALHDSAAGREALAALERDWFAPLLDALKANRIGMLSIHVPDAAECQSFETVRGDLRRFWRRTRTLTSYCSQAA